MKKRIAFILLITFILSFSGCKNNETSNTDSDKIKIVATLFPQYDFAREIAKDKAEITLLLPPGTDSHSYDPTPNDMTKISNCNLFLYTGKDMEIWASRLTANLSNTVKIVDLSTNITLDDDHSHDGHNHSVDPHIWTDPKNAQIMVDTICENLCTLDPENATFFKENTRIYKEKLENLHNEFKSTVSTSKHKKMIFASRFALHYFVKQYGIEYDSAYDSCIGETEPGVKTISKIIQEVKDENIKYIFYAELSDTKVAKSICNETGAEMLMFHSAHNVSKDEFNNNETYLSLMHKNVENLKKGLN